jgi:hypothetical protein
MRVLIVAAGGTIQDILVEMLEGKSDIYLKDWDEAVGENCEAKLFHHFFVTPEEFETALKA